MVNSVSSENPTLSNLEENLFSMTDENTSLLSETTNGQQTAEHQANDEIISEAATVDGVNTAIERVTVDVHHRVSPSMEKKRGEVKTGVARKRPNQVLTQSEKAADKQTNKRDAKVAPNTSQAQKTARTEKGGKTARASTSSAAQPIDMTQLSNILQSSLSTVFSGLTKSINTGFADLGKLIQDTKITEDKEIGSESELSDDEGSDKNEPDEPSAKRQKTADSNPAIIEKLTKDLALEDEKGPDINTQLAGLVHKLLREAKPNEAKLNELKRQYIPPSNCEGLSETRVNSNIWNNLGETARSNDLKLQKVQKYLIKGMTAVVTVVDSLIKDETDSSKEDNIGKLMDAVILLANANTEVNLRRRERLKPELHPSYRHLCNPSNTITSQLFGDDLPKAVKDIAEANKISSKIHGDRRSADRRDKRQRSRPFAGSNSRTPYRPNSYYPSGSKNYHRPPFSNRKEGAKKRQQQQQEKTQ